MKSVLKSTKLRIFAAAVAMTAILTGCADQDDSSVADGLTVIPATEQEHPAAEQGAVLEVASVDWHLNFAEASALAKQEGKLMLLEFHGSDWCPPCIKLQKEVLTQPAFKQYASENLILVDLDFPRRTELSEEQQAHNQELAMRFGVQYFPTVILMTADGEVLDQSVGFPNGGLNGFLEFIRKQVES